MQVSKFLWAVCATTVCAGILSVQAQDTPAQAAARAALLQSMGQPPAAVPAAPKVTPPPPAPKAPAAPVAPAAPPVAAAPVVVAPAAATAPQPLDPEAQAAARAALLQSMGQPATPATPVVAPIAAAPVAAVPTPPAAKPAAATPATASTAGKLGSEAGFAPIVAPPLPISAAKQQALDALLGHYKADQISPEEYHRQRAAILAAP